MQPSKIHLSGVQALLQVVLFLLGSVQGHLAACHVIPGFLQLQPQLLGRVRLRSRQGGGTVAACLPALLLPLLSLCRPE